jgi:hypothetical protein
MERADHESGAWLELIDFPHASGSRGVCRPSWCDWVRPNYPPISPHIRATSTPVVSSQAIPIASKFFNLGLDKNRGMPRPDGSTLTK